MQGFFFGGDHHAVAVLSAPFFCRKERLDEETWSRQFVAKSLGVNP
jgi:hypothetical protein